MSATPDDVRRTALALPATEESTWYGTAGYKVAGKGFLRYRDEADGRLVVFVADLGEKEALLKSNPAAFSTTPHYDDHPVVLVDLGAVDPDELAELVVESWRAKAPVKVRRAYETEARPDQ